MITFREMLQGTSISDVPIAHQHNIQDTLDKVNLLLSDWKGLTQTTSGYRTLQDHIRIYNQKGIFDLSKIPTKSNHLTGRAIDLYDPDLTMTKWLKEDNSRRLIELDLYAEEGNKNWVHIQTVPPKSGKRWFYP